MSGVSKAVATLLDVLRMECYSPGLPLQTDRIHVANGTLFLDGRLEPAKEFCLNRLPVEYHPDAPEPKTWLRFVEELLYDEDIPTLQEYMGYCLLPTTKAQRMLFLIGRGGEGKSRIGPVMRALFGTAMNTGSLCKVETSPFARADLENKLVMVDDDIKLEALPQTHIIKAIVTAELPMDLERKGKQSYQGNMFVRFMAFGNGGDEGRQRPQRGFLPAAADPLGAGTPRRPGGRPVSGRSPLHRGGRHLPLVCGRTAAAAGQPLPLHRQRPHPGQPRVRRPGQQQRGGVHGFHRLYPAPGGCRDHLPGALRHLPAVVYRQCLPTVIGQKFQQLPVPA